MIGRTLAHYEIVALIGQGGMGEVYRARDTRLDREVALKLLPETFAEDPERIARFRREARVLASLNHPNIASVHGFEEVDDGVFLVMELAEGEDLDDRILRGPLPVEDVVSIARQLAEGLEAAHEQGIVHRDLKPANVKLGSDGKVMILDFGLARAVLGDEVDGADPAKSPTITAAMTAAGTVMGTAAYMSPEQARGRPVDKRADIWAFGVILYEMLCGCRLFQGETISDTLADVLRRDIDLGEVPEDTPAPLGFLLQRCLERDPERRLRDIGEARWLLGADDPLRTLSGGVELAEDTPRSDRRAAGRLVTLLPWVLVAVAAVAWFVVRGSGPSRSLGPHAARFTQLTLQGGIETQPSFSPDASFFVYSGWDRRESNPPRIYLQRTGGMKPIALTEGTEGADLQPVLSPDGGRVAFFSFREPAGVYLMGATGESVRLLAPGGSHPSWSPDGRQIAYCTENMMHPASRHGISEIWIMDVESGDKRRLTERDGVQPEWSPDGGRLTFWGVSDAEGGQRDIHTIRADGTDLQRVTNDAAMDWNPVWSADGRWLFFSSDRGGVMNLWRLRVDQSTGQPIGSPEPMTLPANWLAFFAPSQDGQKLIYTDVIQSSNIYSAGLNLSAGVVDSEFEPVLLGSIRADALDVSPDGERIVFRRLGKPEDLFIVGTDGENLTRVTADAYRDRGPTWIEDGQGLLFYSDRSGRYEFWTVRPDGSGLRQRTQTEGRSLWFPLMSETLGLVCGFNEIGTTIFRVDESTGDYVDPTPLPAPSEGKIFFAGQWSPDGRLLAGRVGSGLEDSEKTVTVYDPVSKTYRALDGIVGAWASTAWSPDGSELLFLSHDGIRAANIEDGSSRLLLPRSATMGMEALVIGPSGRSIYFTRVSEGSDLWMAELQAGDGS